MMVRGIRQQLPLKCTTIDENRHVIEKETFTKNARKPSGIGGLTLESCKLLNLNGGQRRHRSLLSSIESLT
jgi:hypothetical protein